MKDVETVTLESGGKSATLTEKLFAKLPGKVAKLTAVVTDDQKATMRAKLEDLRDRQQEVARIKANLKVARESEAAGQDDVNRYAAEICDAQELLGFAEPSEQDDDDTE